MSPANLDVVRSINEAHERGDFSSIEWAHPEVEYVIADGPSPGRWTGPAGMEEAFRDNLIGWKDFRVGVDDYLELDHERVLVLTRSTAHGKAGGLVVGQMRTRGAALYTVRAGKVTKLVYYWDRQRALADVGLSRAGAAADHSG
jgi:ketosteroid isomerase-like protein